MGVEGLVEPEEGQPVPERSTLSGQEFQDQKDADLAAQYEEARQKRRSEDRTD